MSAERAPEGEIKLGLPEVSKQGVFDTIEVAAAHLMAARELNAIASRVNTTDRVRLLHLSEQAKIAESQANGLGATLNAVLPLDGDATWLSAIEYRADEIQSQDIKAS